jgi:hypothetical protein
MLSRVLILGVAVAALGLPAVALGKPDASSTAPCNGPPDAAAAIAQARADGFTIAPGALYALQHVPTNAPGLILVGTKGPKRAQTAARSPQSTTRATAGDSASLGCPVGSAAHVFWDSGSGYVQEYWHWATIGGQTGTSYRRLVRARARPAVGMRGRTASEIGTTEACRSTTRSTRSSRARGAVTDTRWDDRRVIRARPLPPSPLTARAEAAAAPLSDDAVAVWGGIGPNGQPLGDGAILRLDPLAWEPTPAAPIAPRVDPGVAAADGTFVVWGGKGQNDGAGYDAARGSWWELPPAPIEPRVNHVLHSVGTSLLVWGGDDGSPAPPGPRP